MGQWTHCQEQKSPRQDPKALLWIILPNYSYQEALKKLSLEDLQTRRTKLTLKFAKLHKS